MRFRVHDVVLALVSVVLSLLLWFAVAGQKSAEVSVAAPVEFRNMPGGLELVGTVPRTIEIWLRGSPGMVQRLRPGDVYVPLDLSTVTSGYHVVQVVGTEVRVPYGVRIAGIRPESFTLSVERTVTKTLPVSAEIKDEPAPGHKVTSVVSQPAEVTIEGPESRVAPLTSAPTEAVSVGHAQISFQREVSLLPPEVPLRFIDSHSIRVSVRLEAVAAEAKKD
jgi:hypothetical protein